MPTVPETFAPGVTQGDLPMTPASSPWVNPMKNSAPGLLQQTGATLANAGAEVAKLGNTIGDRVQETMDDAQSKAAENQFVQSAQATMAQYMTSEGINATQQWDPTAQAISKARQDGRTALTPIQQRMYDQVTNQHMLGFGTQMNDHRSVEELRYAKQQSVARADMLNGQARTAYMNGDMDGYRKYVSGSEQETLNAAQLNGATPDSDVAQAMLRDKRGELAHSVVAGLLERHAVNEADQYFQKVQGDVDMHTSELLDSAIKTAHMQEDPKTDVERAAMSAAGIKGPGVLQTPIPAGTIATTQGIDGIDIHAAKGTKVLAPGSGTVTKVWTDEDHGLSAQIALPNGYAATFNGLGSVNYEAGSKITVGQVLALSGADDNGRAVTHYSMTGPDGKTIDPRSASSAPLDPRNFSAAEVEEKAVDYINANVADPEERALAVRLARSTANGNREILNQEHSEALKQANDYYVQHGRSLNGLPQNVSMQLTPADLDSFSQERQARAKNDPQTEIDLSSGKIPLTPDNVKAAYAQGKLNDEGYARWGIEAAKLENDPQKIQQVTVDHDQLTNIFAMNQMQSYAFPKNDTDRASRVQLETVIKNDIDIQQQRNNRELSWEEKGKIARDIVTDKVYTAPTWYSGQVNKGLKPVDLATPQELQNATVWVGGQSVRMGDIPVQYTQRAMQDLQNNGVTPTQANIAAWWLRSGSPRQ